MEFSILTEPMNNPLLSICLPTYNRAELLRECLASVGPQVAALAPRVELVISDNCSPDGTREVVDEAAKKWPLVYHRNDCNIGGTANFIRVASLARGEYVWLIGDDDLVTAGSLEHLLGVLQAHPDVDFIYANTSVRPAEIRATLSGSLPPPVMSEGVQCQDPDDHQVRRWEELIDWRYDIAPMVGVMKLVFRREPWVEATNSRLYNDSRYTRIIPWFGQAMLMAVSMVGRPAYYVARPCTLVFCGHQEYSDQVPYIFGLLLHDLIDFYAEAGVPRAIIDKFRTDFLMSPWWVESLIGHEDFSPLRFAWRLRRYPLPVLHTLRPVLKRRCPRLVWMAGKMVVRALRAASRTVHT